MQPKNGKGQYVKDTVMNRIRHLFHSIMWKVEKWGRRK
jgi:hypothetical protein